MATMAIVIATVVILFNFIGLRIILDEIINTDQLVVTQYFCLTAQSLLFTEWVYIIKTARGVCKGRMLPVDARIDNSDYHAFTSIGWIANRATPDIASSQPRGACICVQLQNWISLYAVAQ